jgi:hypothetical protein
VCVHLPYLTAIHDSPVARMGWALPSFRSVEWPTCKLQLACLRPRVRKKKDREGKDLAAEE